MSPTVEQRLTEALRGTPLADRLGENATPLLARHEAHAVVARLDDRVVRGLARVVATSSAAASFLAHRSALLSRLAELDAGYLERRACELEAYVTQPPSADLEGSLDELRLLRREETMLAACLDLGGIVPFEVVSRFLSRIAEAIVRRALGMAELGVGAPGQVPPVSVIGMGKIGGREFTYHSDLDLVFLYDGGAEAIVHAARVAQRLIAYLATMTGAGVAYPVDARLRPSGQQGALVASLATFERYQRHEARTWEHLVLMRARAIAGEVAKTQAVVERTRAGVLDTCGLPWAAIAAMRSRVEQERAQEHPGHVAFKAGPGGLMDFDFLAAGGALERGAREGVPELPSVPALLGRVAPGRRTRLLLESYHLLRVVEARARWLSGRAVEAFEDDAPMLLLLAELVEPGLSGDELLARIAARRHDVREAFVAVVKRGSIDALAH